MSSFSNNLENDASKCSMRGQKKKDQHLVGEMDRIVSISKQNCELLATIVSLTIFSKELIKIFGTK